MNWDAIHKERLLQLRDRVEEEGVIIGYYWRWRNGKNCFCVVGHMADMAGLLDIEVTDPDPFEDPYDDNTVTLREASGNIGFYEGVIKSLQDYFGLNPEQISNLQRVNDDAGGKYRVIGAINSILEGGEQE